ncbi:cAMP phosphodiesterases class-II-domain-containing protein [Lophiotrema nucula]|uniref:cAMP phosphodiesterases class-II-domain-containing protein n=1 Tax=Lophiotrema nucula TaxID=690887 RepID=A0A6A5ZPB6_9PLEO|nr:cAMP phosphodiesterases class-II-domain-containing protein [Lophiotrema nucula]
MKEGDGVVQARRSSGYAHGHASEPAIQVVCLGSGGGPSEDNVTGFLVRSTASKWAKNSVLAVDAGSHLAAITRILTNEFPLVSDLKISPKARNGNGNGAGDGSPSPGTIPYSDEESGVDSPRSELDPPPAITTLEEGPFAGLPFPHASARANALHVVREHVSTYLITHPHLDHVSGFVINTAAFHNTSRPKRLAALPFCVSAIKTHIFNNIVWPNLTDEDGGVGLVTFQRLAEGGNIALGEGLGRGYIEVCDGLSVKGFKVSHGHCMKGPGHVHRGSNANIPPETPGIPHTNTHPQLHPSGPTEIREGRSLSFSFPTASAPGTPLYVGGTADPNRTASVAQTQFEQCVIDSSVFFIRTEPTAGHHCREVLIFGDVEPDSVSLSPRTAHIWAEAAPKIASGVLTGIFIECSYNNTQGDAVLYGHLAPRHLITELQNLAEMVKEARKDHEREREELRKGRKRKRASNGLLMGVDGVGGEGARKSSRTRASLSLSKEVSSIANDDEVMTDYAATPTPGRHTGTQTPVHPSAPAALNLSSVSAEHNKALLSAAFEAPLKGLKVVVMHVKDTLSDGPLVGESILAELRETERVLVEQGRGLGCEFFVSEAGESYYF